VPDRRFPWFPIPGGRNTTATGDVEAVRELYRIHREETVRRAAGGAPPVDAQPAPPAEVPDPPVEIAPPQPFPPPKMPEPAPWPTLPPVLPHFPHRDEGNKDKTDQEIWDAWRELAKRGDVVRRPIVRDGKRVPREEQYETIVCGPDEECETIWGYGGFSFPHRVHDDIFIKWRQAVPAVIRRVVPRILRQRRAVRGERYEGRTIILPRRVPEVIFRTGVPGRRTTRAPFPEPITLPAPAPVEVPRPQPQPLPAPEPQIVLPKPSLPVPVPVPAPSAPPTRLPRRAPAPQRPIFNFPPVPGGFLWNILTRNRSSTSPLQFVSPAGAPSASPAPSPATPPTASPMPFPTPLTSLNAGGVRSCSPCRPSKPRRKCRNRAPVKWAGGPKKGELAGSRCYSFFNP